MRSRTIAVVSAGIGRPSTTRLLGDRLATAAERLLFDEGIEAHTVVVELRDLAQELANATVSGFTAGALRQAVDTVAAADGVIVVTPVYNASYSGLFKSFFDVLEQGALDGKPVLVAATAGSERHSLVLDHALRPLFSYLRAVVVPTGVYAAASDWGSEGEGGNGALADRIDRAARQLAALVAGTAPPRTDDPYATVIPFADLLGDNR